MDLGSRLVVVDPLEYMPLETAVVPPALVSQASCIFQWEEREGEKNTSRHSGQLSVDIHTNV